jgi:uncharacterized protein (TIGR00730 family)
MRISVFGGSQPKPGEPVYQDAILLGKLLASMGYIVLTGGYIGTMEAVSRGGAEVGGHVIGVTCDEIEAWRPVKANHWVTEEWHFSSLQERIFALIKNCDAFLALPGGVGTLVEIILSWNLMLTHILPARPLILIGSGWQSTIKKFIAEQGEFIPEDQRQWITFAPDVVTAFHKLRDMLSNEKYLTSRKST